jgi:glycosyltransferase involved in cell wall biosynthesis
MEVFNISRRVNGQQNSGPQAVRSRGLFGRKASSENRSKRICIVSNGEISQNPRVVKEADALAAAGYDVFVLFAQYAEWTRSLDRAILDRAQWRGCAVEARPGGLRPRILLLILKARVFVFRTLSNISMIAPIAELACSRYLVEQLWLAVRARADLYIGHYPPSLPVVAWAAWLTGASYGFDFEDFYQGQSPTEEADNLFNRLIAVIEARYLPKACLLTAASRGIAREVARLHGCREPVTIMNAFAWADRTQIPSTVAPPARTGRLSLYWFSQIISLDRGLQDVIRAIGLIRNPVELHIRGAATAEVKTELLSHARRCGRESAINFHDPIPPENLLASALQHDVGLCLEVPSTLNRDVCITNKMFLYMLAGLAVIASRTRGHLEIFKMNPNVGFLYESGDVKGLATIIERLSENSCLLAQTKGHALDAAREHWNWERESRVLLTSVEQVI